MNGLRETITIGPFSAFFTNVNSEMGLPGHSHFAMVTLVYKTSLRRGFPAFATTYRVIQEHIKALTASPFRDMTNEDVAAKLWTSFDNFTHPEIDVWGGAFTLERLELAVRGVPDRIGHADGFTIYALERDHVHDRQAV